MNITDFIAATGNKFASVAEEGIVAGDVAGFVDSGSYTLNALLSGSIYGGFPSNKITIISSESGAGKCARGSQAIEVYKENKNGQLFLKKLTYKELVDEVTGGRRKVGEQVPVADDQYVYIRTPTAWTRIVGVIEKDPTEIIRVEFENGKSFECSPSHLFSSSGRPVLAKDAEWVDTLSGTLRVISKKSIAASEPVYDISIPYPHWYLTEEGGIIHHNTFLSLGAAKLFQDKHEEGVVVYFESESAVSKSMMKERGLDLARTGVVPVSTVQEFKTQSLKLIDVYEKTPEKERKPLFLVLDSLGMLSTSKEMEDSLQGADTKDMTRPGQIKSAFRTLTLRLGRAQIPLLVTNHVYSSMSNYSGPVSGGGTGPTYSGSTCLSLTKAQDKNSENEVVGAIVTVTVTKGRLTREKSKAKCMIRHETGLDRYYGLLDFAEEARIFKKVSTRYELPDGRKVFGKAINENPEDFYTKEILDQIDVHVGKKFKYGGGFTENETVVDSTP